MELQMEDNMNSVKRVYVEKKKKIAAQRKKKKKKLTISCVKLLPKAK